MDQIFPSQLSGYNSIVYYIILLWSLFWKGIALYRAAKNDQRNWFIVLLIINIFGILEIIYLFRFAKKRLTIEEIKSWLPKSLK